MSSSASWFIRIIEHSVVHQLNWKKTVMRMRLRMC